MSTGIPTNRSELVRVFATALAGAFADCDALRTAVGSNPNLTPDERLIVLSAAYDPDHFSG
jgi:hypothetical protein